MCEQVLGADHPLTACSLSNLAGLYQERGKYDQAETLAQQAVARLEQVIEGNGALSLTVFNLDHIKTKSAELNAIQRVVW